MLMTESIPVTGESLGLLQEIVTFISAVSPN